MHHHVFRVNVRECSMCLDSLLVFQLFSQDLQNGLSNNTHNPIDMSRLCNVECVHIYMF